MWNTGLAQRLLRWKRCVSRWPVCSNHSSNGGDISLRFDAGEILPISRVMHYLYNGMGGLRYHPWHLLLPWFMADMSHNKDYTSRQCCCGVYSQRLRVTGVEVLDRTDGVWWTHHLPAHEFWRNIGINHFNATLQTNFTVMHGFCTCWECAGAFKKSSRISKDVQMCGFVHCKRAEALVK